jgi:tRNA pseudouridine55 synthase
MMDRKGEEVELAAKPIHIDEIELTDFDPVTMQMSIRVVCGKGTYIRSLARDIGHALGSGAFLTALCRTRVGDVRIENCLTFDEFPAWLEQQMSNSERVK